MNIISITPGELKFIDSTHRKWDIGTTCGKRYTLCDISYNNNLPNIKLLNTLDHQELLTLHTAFKEYSKMVIINVTNIPDSKNHLLDAITAELREVNIDRVITNGTENL